MKMTFVLFSFFFCGFIFHSQAQSCCDKLRQAGIESYNKGDYTDAIRKWEAAKTCATKCKTDDLDNWIGKAKAKLNPSNPKPVVKAIKPEMVFVQGGTFTMGCKDGHGRDSGDSDCNDNEKPAHSVTLSDFYIGKYEVTFEEYDAFCIATNRKKPDDEGWGRSRYPVVNVNRNDAIAYCNWLSKQTGKKYRLPTEAEWEYAARGGANSSSYLYAGSNNIDEVAWYQKNAKRQTYPGGQKKANELGIYDMSGNVLEWCSDWYADYTPSVQTNPKGPIQGDICILRGGNSFSFFNLCSITNRLAVDSSYRGIAGFRIAQDQ